MCIVYIIYGCIFVKQLYDIYCWDFGNCSFKWRILWPKKYKKEETYSLDTLFVLHRILYQSKTVVLFLAKKKYVYVGQINTTGESKNYKLHNGPKILKKSRPKNSWNKMNQFHRFFFWYFPQKIFSWYWFIWFHEFFWPELFEIIWPTVIGFDRILIFKTTTNAAPQTHFFSFWVSK